MTDQITAARNVLAKWRDQSTAGPWRVDVFGHDGAFVQIVQPAEFQPGYDPNRFDQMDLDIANIEQSSADARLIVGTAGNPALLDALEWFLLFYAALAETAEQTDEPHPKGVDMAANRIAAAILAADNQMNGAGQ